MDTLEYTKVDCTKSIFNAWKYQNRNMTVYVSFCKMLPLSTFYNEDLPNDLEVKPSNIFISRKGAKNDRIYKLLNFSQNNGQTMNHSQVVFYYRLDDIDLDLYLNVVQSKNDTTVMEVEDTYYPSNNVMKKR